MVKNLKKILSVLCVLLMTATVFSAVVTNVLADENDREKKAMVFLNTCIFCVHSAGYRVALNRYPVTPRILWVMSW